MSNLAKKIAEGLAAAWSSGKVEKMASFFTDGCVFEDVCGGIPSKKEVKQWQST
jgi:hypothetical protein